jgi:hypothetical protein
MDDPKDDPKHQSPRAAQPDGGGKTLLPELLPTPTPAAGSSAKERVQERARQLLARLRDVGALAGAAAVGVHCGDTVGGYGVVDPLPPPAQSCTSTPNPFERISTWATYGARPPDPPRIDLRLEFGSATVSELYGVHVLNTRVTGGRLVAIDDRFADNPHTPFVTVVLAPDTEMSVLTIELDLGCGTATATRRFRIKYYPPGNGIDTLTVEPLP